MNWTVAMFVLSAVGVLGTVFIAWGRMDQKMNDHTTSDERRFTEVSEMLSEIRGDIKDLLKR